MAADLDKVTLSFIEDRLISDSDGEYKLQLIKQLEDEIKTLKRIKNNGLKPDEFLKVDKVIQAMDASVNIVNLTWAKHHLKQSK